MGRAQGKFLHDNVKAFDFDLLWVLLFAGHSRPIPTEIKVGSVSVRFLLQQDVFTLNEMLLLLLLLLLLLFKINFCFFVFSLILSFSPGIAFVITANKSKLVTVGNFVIGFD